jgi:hypothetical protein
LKRNQTIKRNQMTRGGARKGAGRKPGSATRLNQEAREKALADGVSPLSYMLSVLRNEKLDRDARMDAAKAAAPYVHAKLASVEHSGSIGVKSAREVTDDELANIAAGSSEGTSESSVDPSQLN